MIPEARKQKLRKQEKQLRKHQDSTKNHIKRTQQYKYQEIISKDEHEKQQY